MYLNQILVLIFIIARTLLWCSFCIGYRHQHDLFSGSCCFLFAGNISLVASPNYSPVTKITLGAVNSNVGAPMVSHLLENCFVHADALS